MRLGRMMAMAGCALTMMGAAIPAAHAQRVISDYEASKLTLDALTATPAPIIHHALARRVVGRHGAHGFAVHYGTVHQIAYHPHMIALHGHAHHLRHG